MTFQIVRMIEGTPATIYVDDLEAAADQLGLTICGTETRQSLRPILQGMPKILGFVGPCYGGTLGGVDVIRYEDQAVYAEFSQ